MLYRLTYISLIRPEAAAILPSTVEDVLVQSVANNRRDHVTGFLLCDGESFIQILEGPQSMVEACYARIEADDRHHQVRVRERDPVPARLFPRWSMCGLTLSPSDDVLFSQMDISFDLQTAPTGALIQILTSLAARHGRQLDAHHDRMFGGGLL